jgi:hypothetical protein
MTTKEEFDNYYNQEIPLEEEISTGIRKIFDNSYQAWFKIKNQTFFLEPEMEDDEETNLQNAKWMKIQLKKALTKLQLKKTQNER